MAINLSDNIKTSAPKPSDSRYLNNLVTYTGTSQVNSIIPVGERYTGLTINISGVEYWYKNNITGLPIIKSVGGTLTGATNGIHLANSDTQVALGGTLSGDTTFNNGVLLYNSHPDFTSKLFALIDKQYADDIVTGLRPKAAVVVTTVSGITLSGLQTVDGVLLSLGDRVLVKNQSSGQTNGIYSANTSTWGRTPDFDGTPASETVSGSYVWVLTGTTNGNTAWVLDTPDPIIIHDITGTSLSFVLFNHVQDVTAGTGITVNTITGTHQINLSVPTQNILAATITGATGGITKYDSRNVCLDTTTQSILSASITGATNGLIKYNSRNVCLDVNWLTGYTQSAITNNSNTVNVYNISANYLATCDSDFIGVTGGTGICITLPATPKVGQKITVSDVRGTAVSDIICVIGNGRCIAGSGIATINTDYGSLTFVNNNAIGALCSWSAIAFVL
jgi:hypothetical protein